MLSHMRQKYDAYQSFCEKLLASGETLVGSKKTLAIRSHPPELVEIYKEFAKRLKDMSVIARVFFEKCIRQHQIFESML